MKYHKLLIAILLLMPALTLDLSAQQYDVLWVTFNDKSTTPFSIGQPQNFLSDRALARRNHQQIPIDSLDIPVCDTYISDVVQVSNGEIHLHSRWLNGILIKVSDSSIAQQIRQLTFVESCIFITRFATGWPYISTPYIPQPNTSASIPTPVSFEEQYYGSAWQQIHLCEGEFLHRNELLGTDILIAVLDAGFSGLYNNSYLDSLLLHNNIIDRYSFLRNDTNIAQGSDHGLKVLSIMAGHAPNKYVGTAPRAQYALYQTDHAGSESYLEVFTWIAALERADSIGADIVNNSLGYTTFDEAAFNFALSEMDGHSNIITQVANIGATKGMLIVNSAGNYGNTLWQHVTFPADAQKCLTVGNVNTDGYIHHTSGKGLDSLYKPDITALGTGTRYINENNSISIGSGNSFSTPIISGLSACYWQLNKSWTPELIIEKLKTSAHLGINDSMIYYGYGIPNFRIMSQEYINIHNPAVKDRSSLTVFPNPAQQRCTISSSIPFYKYLVYDVLGRLQQENILKKASLTASIDLSDFPKGMYIIMTYTDNGLLKIKFTKQ